MNEPLRIKSSELYTRFGTYLDEALNVRPVVINRYGTPKAVLLPFEEYTRWALTLPTPKPSETHATRSEAAIRPGPLVEGIILGQVVIISRYGTPEIAMIPFRVYEQMAAPQEVVKEGQA